MIREASDSIPKDDFVVTKDSKKGPTKIRRVDSGSGSDDAAFAYNEVWTFRSHRKGLDSRGHEIRLEPNLPESDVILEVDWQTGDPHVGKAVLALVELRLFAQTDHVGSFRSIVGEAGGDRLLLMLDLDFVLIGPKATWCGALACGSANPLAELLDAKAISIESAEDDGEELAQSGLPMLQALFDQAQALEVSAG